jgi:DNA-binding transcriptional regulator GbsR (MarR family)
VEEALRTADDFLSAEELRTRTGANRNQLSAALHHLQKCKAVEAVAAQDKLYWFYAGGDTRVYHVEARAPEDKPRRLRLSIKTKVLGVTRKEVGFD